jgi:hypothetical protein
MLSDARLKQIMFENRGHLEGLRQCAREVEQALQKEIEMKWDETYAQVRAARRCAEARYLLGNLNNPPRKADNILKAIERMKRADAAYARLRKGNLK